MTTTTDTTPAATGAPDPITSTAAELLALGAVRATAAGCSHCEHCTATIGQLAGALSDAIELAAMLAEQVGGERVELTEAGAAVLAFPAAVAQ